MNSDTKTCIAGSSAVPPDVLIPVIDLLGGQVVHAVAGRRSEYRPVQSRLTGSSRPIEVARAFRDRLGLRRLYLADLDAIAGREPAWAVYAGILNLGLELLVDAGVRSAADAGRLAERSIPGIVVGLETLSSPRALPAIRRRLGPARLIFGLDLRGGQPLGDRAAWDHAGPLGIAARAVAAGARRVLVLDLARVGVDGGPGTAALCRRVGALRPGLELLAGGGVRDWADVRALAAAGVSGVLVASAVHDGRITGDTA